MVDDPARLAGVTQFGVDETAWLSVTRDHHILFVAGLVDTATRMLLDIVGNRTATAVTSGVAAIDMSQPWYVLRPVGRYCARQ